MLVLLIALLEIYDLHILLTDRKSQVAFQCLIHLLPSPPRKGIKVPRLSPDVLMKQFFQKMEVGSIVVCLECTKSSHSEFLPTLRTMRAIAMAQCVSVCHTLVLTYHRNFSTV